MTDQDLIVLGKLFLNKDNHYYSSDYQNASYPELTVDNGGASVYVGQGGNRDWKKRSFEYIKNLDGSIRWMWPKENRSPDFLKFYSAMSLKAMIYEQVLKWTFYIPILRKFFIKNFVVRSSDELYIDQLTQESSGKYAIFTGTVGPNRKIVVYNKSIDENEFLKIPVGQSSLKSLTNEFNNAELFKDHQDYVQTPEIGFKDSVLSSSDLEISTSKSYDLLPQTQVSLMQVWDRTTGNKILSELLDEIESVPKVELRDLKIAYNKVLKFSFGEDILTSLNHGDFTPWNCFQESTPVKIFDLEFASKNLPLYYDAFHFWIQHEIMCTSSSNEEVLGQVKSKWQKSLFYEHAISLSVKYDDALKNYLLFITDHYYKVYSKQDQLHEQGKKLINFLVYALEKYANAKVDISLREYFIEEISHKLKNTEHAILKEFNGIGSVVHSHSDIDMVMKKESAETFISSLLNNSIVSKKITRKSYMITLELYFEDLSFLSIDFIHHFKRKSKYYLDAQIVLDKSFLGKDGLKYASPHCNTEYILLFYLLNDASVPEKYLNCFRSYPPLVFGHVSFYLNEEYGFSLQDVLDKKKETEIKNRLKKHEQDFSKKHSFSGKWNYLKDTSRELFFGVKSPLISFSGVDGAGKTTILYNFKEILETRYRKKVVVIRHRPSILPILSAYVHGKEKASEISMSKLPRQGSNKNVISSFIRFCYYYLDYIFGQLIISFKYSRRGIIVLYDRYYYDFILDGIRSNINLPSWVIKPLFRFVHKPELNFFLWASSEVILSRKEEMKKEDIVELTSKYKSLFMEFSDKYTSHFESIENIIIDQTLNRVLTAFMTKIKRSK